MHPLFVLRPALPADLPQVRAIYAPYCYTPISFELEPPSIEEMRGRLAKVLGQYPWLVCEDGGEVALIGNAVQHASNHDPMDADPIGGRHYCNRT